MKNQNSVSVARTLSQSDFNAVLHQLSSAGSNNSSYSFMDGKIQEKVGNKNFDILTSIANDVANAGGNKGFLLSRLAINYFEMLTEIEQTGVLKHIEVAFSNPFVPDSKEKLKENNKVYKLLNGHLAFLIGKAERIMSLTGGSEKRSLVA